MAFWGPATLLTETRMQRGIKITAIILFMIVIAIYFGFIYLVGNAGG